MRRLKLAAPASGYFEVLPLRIIVAAFNKAISLSVALNRPSADLEQ